MPKQTSCSLAYSVTCDNTQENHKAFKAAFAAVAKALNDLTGSEAHGTGNGQFYGSDFVGCEEVYFNDETLAEGEPAKPATSIKK